MSTTTGIEKWKKVFGKTCDIMEQDQNLSGQFVEQFRYEEELSNDHIKSHFFQNNKKIFLEITGQIMLRTI